MGHVLMENRHGLVVDTEITRAAGFAGRLTAVAMVDDLARPGGQRIMPGADRAYDTREFVSDLRDRGVTPHVAQNTSGRRPAINRIGATYATEKMQPLKAFVVGLCPLHHRNRPDHACRLRFDVGGTPRPPPLLNYDDDPLVRERRMAMVSDRHALAEVERGLAGFLAAIEDGLYLPAMKTRITHLDAEGVRLRARIRVASTMADAEQIEALRHRTALGQLIERVAVGRAGDNEIIRLRDLFGPIALLPTGERGACRLVEVGKLGST